MVMVGFSGTMVFVDQMLDTIVIIIQKLLISIFKSNKYGVNSKEYFSIHINYSDSYIYRVGYQEINRSGAKKRNTSRQTRERQRQARARKQIAVNELKMINNYKESFLDAAKKSTIAKTKVQKETIDEKQEQDIQINVTKSALDKMPDSIKDKVIEASKVENIINTRFKNTPETKLIQAKYRAFENIGALDVKLKNIGNTTGDKSKYLYLQKPSEERNQKDILNDLNESIIERKDFFQKFDKSPFSELNVISIAILKEFIKEFQNDFEKKKIVEKYYNSLNHHVKESTEKSLLAYCKFESALEPYPELKILFSKCSDEIIKEVFEEKLKALSNPEITKQYEALEHTREQNFDWNVLFNDKLLTNQLHKHLDSCVLDCPTYMESISQLYDINIRYYTACINGTYELRKSFNSINHVSVLHLIKKDNKFFELSINENLMYLDNYRQALQPKYKQIIHDIESCVFIDDIKSYLNENRYENDVELDDLYENDSYLYNFVTTDDLSFILELCKIFIKEDERAELHEKLQRMIQVGASSTLHYLADRLRHVEDSQTTIRDIQLVINTAIAHAEQGINFVYLDWILISQEPKDWTIYLTLYRLENYLEKKLTNNMTNQWKGYLKNIKDKNIIVLFCLKLSSTEKAALDVDELENILFLLSVSFPDPLAISGLNLQEWAFVLKELFWKYKLHSSIGWTDEDEYFQNTIHLLLKIEHHQQFMTTRALIDTLATRHDQLFDQVGRSTMISILENIADEAWSISDDLLNIIRYDEVSTWMTEIKKVMPSTEMERDAKLLVDIILNRIKVQNSNTNAELQEAQNRILSQIEEVSESITNVKQLTEKFRDLSISELQEWSRVVKQISIDDRKLMIEEMFAKISCAVKLWSGKNQKNTNGNADGFFLRDTQLLASLIIVKHKRNTLLQVATGEGKSLIVAAVAITRALLGKQVDIITTSSVLAKRDAEELAGLYDIFNISIGHNTDIEILKRQAAYKSSNVVYGDLPSFQRDYLLDKFYGNNVMSGRSFQNVLIDEVDSMLLDRGNNTLYLSHEIPELDKLETIYLYIWTRIVMGKTSAEESSMVWDTETIAREVLTSLYGLIDTHDLRKVYKQINPDLNQKLLKTMYEKKTIDENNCVISTVINMKTLHDILVKETGDDSLLIQLKDLLQRRKDRVMTEEDISTIIGHVKMDAGSIFQTLKNEKIINHDGKIVKDENNIDEIKINLTSYSGIVDVMDPLIQLLKKLMKSQIKIEDLHFIQLNVLDEKCVKLTEILKTEGIVDEYGHIREKFFERRALTQKLEKYGEAKAVLNSLLFLIQRRIDRVSIVTAPKYLKPFILDNLNRWIENAKLALYLRDQEDYVVDIDRTGLDGNTVVTILDKDTGTDQSNSQWDAGLHQFIQLKHGCRLTTQSLKAVFVSNVMYFKLYDQINGLSGTLGSDVEREHLVKAHDVDFLMLPTFKQKKFSETNPFVVSSIDDWETIIFDQTLDMVTTKGRSVLIICEVVEMVEELSRLFAKIKHKYNYQIRTYTRDYEKLDVIHEQQKLLPGFVIIATNLAGRGTDIKLSEELIKNGGLHLILSYLPDNDRIEQQAMGRTARKGDPGSGQLIILSKEFGQEISNNNYKMLKLRSERRLKEAEHISGVRKFYEDQIQFEEQCFKMFRNVWEANVSRLNGFILVGEQQKDILKRGVLDKWAFWLDNHIGHGRKVDKELVTNQCKQFLHNIETLSIDKSRYSDWVDDLAQLVMLGKSFICMTDFDPDRLKSDPKSSDFESAKSHFGRVISKEPEFSEMAHYYMALVAVKMDSGKDSIEKSLTKSLQMFEKRKDCCLMSKALISNLKQYTASMSSQSKAFEDQQTQVYAIYDSFEKSIHDILGHYVDKNLVMEYGRCKNYEAELAFELLSKKSDVVGNITLSAKSFDGEFEQYCNSNNVSHEQLREIINKQGSSIKHFKRLRNEMNDLVLPCRTSFWEYLKLFEVIHTIEEFYHLPKDNVREIEPGLFEMLEKCNTLMKLPNDKIYLYPEPLETENDFFAIKKSDLEAIIPVQCHEFLRNHGCLLENKYANLNRRKLIDLDFEQFNSIKEDALALQSALVEKPQSKEILDSLESIGILERYENAYKPTSKFYSFEFSVVDTTIPEIFHHWIMQQLQNAFAYKIAYHKLCKDLIPVEVEEKNFNNLCDPKQIKAVLDVLCSKQILTKSCLGGYIVTKELSEINFENDLETFTEKYPNLVQSIKSQITSIENLQAIHFNHHHNRALKINLPSNLPDILIGQMVARGIIGRQKLTNTKDLANTKDDMTNTLKSEFSIDDLRELPSVRICSEEIEQYLKKSENVKEMSNSSYEITAYPSLPDVLSSGHSTKTAFQYLCARYLIGKPDFIENMSNFFFNGRGTINIFENFDMVTKSLSECTSLRSKTEERQFFINGADTILIGQEKPEDPDPPSFWGWILGIVLSIIVIVVGLALCVLVGSGIPILAIGILMFIVCCIGLAATQNALNIREQKERLNADTITTFMSNIQMRIQRLVPSKQLTQDESNEVQQKISVQIEKANFIKMINQFEIIMQEKMNQFQEDIYNIVTNEIDSAIVNRNIVVQLSYLYHVYEVSDVDFNIDDQEEFHMDSDRLKDILETPFTTFKNNVLNSFKNGSILLEMPDIKNVSTFKNSVSKLFTESTNKFKFNRSEIYQAINEDIIESYLEDLNDLKRNLKYQNNKIMEDEKQKKVADRLERFKKALENSVLYELNKTKADTFEQIKVAYLDKINILAQKRLTEIVANITFNQIRVNEADLKGKQSSSIQNISLIKNEYYRLMARKIIFEKCNKENIHESLRGKSFEQLKQDGLRALVIQKFKNVINNNPSYFKEILNLPNSDTLVTSIIQDMVNSKKDQPVIKYLEKSFEYELNPLLVGFAQNGAFFSAILKRVMEFTQHDNFQNIVTSKKDLFRVLILSTIIQANSKLVHINDEEQEDVEDFNDDTAKCNISFIIVNDEIIFAGSSFLLKWNGLRQILVNALKLLQKGGENVTKATILKDSTKNSDSDTQVLSYLESILEPSDPVKLFNSDGQIQSYKMFKDALIQQNLNVHIDQTIPFYMIENLEKLAAAFLQLIYIANHCEKNRQIFADNYNQNLKEFLKQRKAKNIFNVVPLKLDEHNDVEICENENKNDDDENDESENKNDDGYD